MHGIILKDVCYSYGNKKVLKNISVEIPSGMFGLLGRNGAGKTTMMKLITGLLPLQSGTIKVEGVSVTNIRELRKNIGYLSQDFDFYHDMNVLEALHYLAVLDHIPRQISKKRVEELLDLVNLRDVSRDKVKALSGGMKRRLGIAQALLNDPSVLIVDEPTAGLDPEERIRLRKLLGELASKKTVLLSTHITGDIESSTRNLAILNQGKMIYRGTIDDILENTKNYTYEGIVSRDSFHDLDQAYHVYEQQDTLEGIRVKLLSGRPVGSGFTPTRPSLEAAYLNVLYGEGNR
ncbi:MAG: ABC transporter ATP-binding protein [Tissierellia bacterium]|nr:ABC transporter ATP-binding protein [Tissierellia bacterium]